MRRSLALLGLVLAIGGLPRARAEEPLPASRAFIAIVAPTEPAVPGQAIRVGVRVGYDREWFSAHAVPLFHRTLDEPLQVDAPWIGKLAGVIPAPEATPAAEGPRIAANGEAVVAVRRPDETRDGRPFTVLEVTRTWRPRREGDLPLSAPTLRFSHASRFREDLVGGRIAEDPRVVLVTGEARTVHVIPLPETGKPASFAGAVGRFRVTATADRAEAKVGEAFPLRLEIEGEGNLDLLPPPSPGDLVGFHVFGTLDSNAYGRRILTYDVAATSADVRAIPAIPFPHYDPSPPGAYRTATTTPIPFRVVGAAKAAEAPPDEALIPPAARGLLVLAAGLIAALVVRAVARRRSA